MLVTNMRNAAQEREGAGFKPVTVEKKYLDTLGCPSVTPKASAAGLTLRELSQSIHITYDKPC